MVFGINTLSILGVMLAGIIVMVILRLTYKPNIRYAMKTPPSRIPGKMGIWISVLFYFLVMSLLVWGKILCISSVIPLTAITAALCLIAFRMSRKYLSQAFPEASLTDEDDGRISRRKLALFSNIQFAILLPVMACIGTVNLLIYLFPDITTVAESRQGFYYTVEYGWPEGQHPEATHSYIYNRTSDSLFYVAVLYDKNRENYYNEYCVAGRYAPGAFCKTPSRPNYIMTRIPSVRKAQKTKLGTRRNFSSYLVNRKMLNNFRYREMDIYGLFPNRETRLGIPQTAWITDTSAQYDYENTIKKAYADRGIDINMLRPNLDRLPYFPEGTDSLRRYIEKSIVYPPLARDAGIEGSVTVAFNVLADGKIAVIGITRSDDPSLDAEAIRIIGSMPRWKPGILAGHRAPCRMTQTVTFKL